MGLTVVLEHDVFQRLVDSEIQTHIGYHADDAWYPSPPERHNALLQQVSSLQDIDNLPYYVQPSTSPGENATLTRHAGKSPPTNKHRAKQKNGT